MALDAFRQNEYSPRAIMERLNKQVFANTLESQFLTAFLGVLDLETLRLKFVNASHPCPVLYGEKRFELLDTEGLCCGMFESPKYEEREVQLQPGERVLLYTRGLTQACDAGGHPYEQARLFRLLQANREVEIGAMVDRISEDLRHHLADGRLPDDAIVLGLEILPREARVERIVIPSEPMQINRVESLIVSRLEALNYGERTIFGIRLALEEALVNAIKHGNRMDKAKKVTICYAIDKNECLISVEDQGEGFDPDAVPDPTADENLEMPHGRGLVLMRAYMDEVTFNRKGNRVTLRKKAPWTT